MPINVKKHHARNNDHKTHLYEAQIALRHGRVKLNP